RNLIISRRFRQPQTASHCTDSSSAMHALDQTQSVPEGHCRKSQTATVTPAKPGDYPFHLSPGEAEELLKTRGLKPFEERPDPSNFDPMTAEEWTLAMAAAWFT